MNKQMEDKKDAFDRYEALPKSYHQDPRWKEVDRLRKLPDNAGVLESNGLVMTIRDDWGF